MQKLRCFLFVLIGTVYFNFAQTLKSPSEFLGYDIGTQFSRHHQVVDYFKHVESTMPNNVMLEQYGSTNERRPLYLAYISSEENLRNIEAIRANHLKTAKLVDGSANDPKIAVVWLSYNVHGNEASSTEASMLTIYKLLTEKQEWLKNTLVIIDPCINPDGRDRYVNWYNETASKPYDLDQQASEHNEPWPGGRANHYLFDLNRDWAWASQIETQSRLKVYNKWLPHIHVDFHEMGINSPYYFPPAAEPFHEIITDWQRDFQTQIGKNHAKYFDKEGWLFFTREDYDLLYPSYGDTYPTFMGAIGMTYEQGGSSRAGLGVLNDENQELTLVKRLIHHTTTGLSTLEMASKNVEKLNTEYAKFFNNSELKYKSYLLQGNPDKIESLKVLLDKHNIKYGRPSNEKVSGYGYNSGKQITVNAKSNDLVVSTNQTKGKMIKALFEPKAKLSDSLTYDSTSWSIPYAYGLNAIASTSNIKTSNTIEGKMPTVLPEAYGYVSQWKSLKDGKFLAALLKSNIRVRYTEKPFTSNGENFDRGSLIITKGDNSHLPDFLGSLNAITLSEKQNLGVITSGFSDSFPDIGSASIKLINRQKIAMVSGDGINSLSYGSLWHFFEQQLKYPVTSINTDNFSRTDLDKYNVLIMPSGNYNKMLNDTNMKKLKDWVRSGGKVIAIERALNAFVDKEGFSLSYKTVDKDKDTKEVTNLLSYAEREREASNDMLESAIFKSTVDNTHPIAFGYNNYYFTYKTKPTAYKLLNTGYNIAYLSDAKVYSGFVGQRALKQLDNTVVFGQEPAGSGSYIYFVDDVMFRSFWENGKLFLVNAIFFE